jgi:hypothetical protein
MKKALMFALLSAVVVLASCGYAAGTPGGGARSGGGSDYKNEVDELAYFPSPDGQYNFIIGKIYGENDTRPSTCVIFEDVKRNEQSVTMSPGVLQYALWSPDSGYVAWCWYFNDVFHMEMQHMETRRRVMEAAEKGDNTVNETYRFLYEHDTFRNLAAALGIDLVLDIHQYFGSYSLIPDYWMNDAEILFSFIIYENGGNAIISEGAAVFNVETGAVTLK